MEVFLEYFFLGLSNGAIYASIALAIVLLYKSIDQPNLSQGEMATFSTILAWFLIEYGFPYWLAFFACLLLSFLFGAILEFIFYKRVENEPDTSKFMVLIALFLIINGISGLIFGYDPVSFPSPFAEGSSIGNNTYITNNQLFSLVMIFLIVVLMTLFYRYTKVGLALRAISEDHTASSLMGINVSFMLILNWGLSASIGATSGMLVAPIVFLDPNMMLNILIFALAGAVLGGITSPLGAVVGCLLLGLINALLINYLDIVNRQLEIGATLLVVVLILLFKPEGLFVKKTTQRV